MKKYQLFFNQLKKAKLFFSLMLISVFSVISLPSQAQELEDDNVKFTQKYAEAGDKRAQNALGTMYYFGEGVKQDYAQAVKWFRKAAEQGDANAQFALGGMYDYGKGVKQDYAQAVKWYRKAAEQGYAIAQFRLGLMYGQGEGVKKNRTQAKKWFKQACDNGEQNGCKILKELN